MSGEGVASIGALLGALVGIIIFLLRVLVTSKNEHIAALEEQVRQVSAERDLFRELLLTRGQG